MDADLFKNRGKKDIRDRAATARRFGGKLFIASKQCGAEETGGISETIEFPRKFVIAGNIALAAWIILNAAGLGLVNLAGGIAFLLVLLIAVYGILKFLGCLRPCYNCKKCTFGMGRLAALYFGKRSLKDYKYNYRLPVALFYFILLGPLPAAILLASTIQAFTLTKTAVLVILLAFTVFSASTWRITPRK